MFSAEQLRPSKLRQQRRCRRTKRLAFFCQFHGRGKRGRVKTSSLAVVIRSAFARGYSESIDSFAPAYLKLVLSPTRSPLPSRLCLLYVAFPKSSIRPLSLPIYVARVPAPPFSLLPLSLTLITRTAHVLAPATLAALPSTRAIETRSLPISLAATHRGFAFYVAFPQSSIPSIATCCMSLIPLARSVRKNSSWS